MRNEDLNYYQINQLNKCDESAFELFFHKYYSALCNFALGFINVEDEVEDVVQNVFINFFNNLKKGLRFNDPAEVRNYLYKSVRNRCLNFKRDNKRQDKYTVGEEMNSNYFALDMELDIIRNEILSIIFDAINKLPQACKDIFIHSYVDEWSDKQIADKYNISLNTVKTQKLRAKKKLKDMLGNLLFDK